MRRRWMAGGLAAGLVWGPCALADTATLTPKKDNTLFESATGQNSDGAGTHFYVGKIAQGPLRRGLLNFDIASTVPAGSTITAVTLTLNLSKTHVFTPMTVELHDALKDWGEGTSNSGDASGGQGMASTTNDATWKHTFFSGSFWTNLGGDFSSTTSGSVAVMNLGSYTVSSTAQMVADVQNWLNTPSGNFGWLLKANAGTNGEGTAGAAVRFDTRENTTANNRPKLTITYTPAGPPQWNINGGGSWGGANWVGGVPNAQGAVASFLGKLTTAANAPATITLDGSRTVGTLTFNNTMTNGVNANSYVISPGTGGTLTMSVASGNAAITLTAGSHAINVPVTASSSTDIDVVSGKTLTLGAGLTVAAGKTLTKKSAGAMDVTGGISLGSGAGLVVNASGGTVSAGNVQGGSLVIHSGGTVMIKTDGSNNGVSVLSALTFDGTTAAPQGKLDLKNNDMIVQAAAGTRATVLDAITKEIKAARNASATLWQGNGITTSAAGAVTGLAVVLNDNGSGGTLFSSFDGQGADINATLVKFTYNGDATLNGVVGPDDYFQIDTGFASRFAQGFTATYRNGDFDYNGLINADDYFLIDSAFLNLGATLGEVGAAASLASVPEPGVMGLAAVAVAGLAMRRRRMG